MARCRNFAASAFPAPVLGVPDNLANIDTDERRWRIGHVAERVEGRLRGPGVFLGVEELAVIVERLLSSTVRSGAVLVLLPPR